MLKQNFIKEKLATGNPVIGTWTVIPSLVTTDIVSSSGLDFLIIDSEHGPINFESAQEMCMVCESNNVSPIMRLGGVIESELLRALDIGVHGVQVPNVSSIEETKKIVQYSKYPPQGNRGFSPYTRAGSYSKESSKKLFEESNENTLIAINIEGIEAIENIDSILSVNELDIVFIGTYDLSKALGIPGETTDSKIQETLKDLTKKINKSGKVTGTIATDLKQIDMYLDMGMSYIVYLVDCYVLNKGYIEAVNHFTNNLKN